MNDVRNPAQAPPVQNAGVPELADDEGLLALMLRDASRQPQLYQPGPYWRRRTRNSIGQIRRCGIGDFRGMSSTIGSGFSDLIYLDVRHDLNGGMRSVLRVMLNSLYPFNTLFGAQAALTRSHEAEARRLRGMLLGANPRVGELAERYRIPPSLLGGCINHVDVAGQRIAAHYLNILHQHDLVAQSCSFSDISSILEIGGGFGAHVHCLIENYPKLKKVVYLDIPPNLYIGTQYLRAFYGAAVIDYRQTRERSIVSFSDDDALEILAVAPWQIERLQLSVDLLYNAHSFVEMPAHVIANYVRHVATLPGFEETRIVMLTYDNFDPHTTLDPERLPGFFPSKSFDRREFSLPDRKYGVISFVSRPLSTPAVTSKA